LRRRVLVVLHNNQPARKPRAHRNAGRLYAVGPRYAVDRPGGVVSNPERTPEGIGRRSVVDVEARISLGRDDEIPLAVCAAPQRDPFDIRDKVAVRGNTVEQSGPVFQLVGRYAF
jgi:hypothetical protein